MSGLLFPHSLLLQKDPLKQMWLRTICEYLFPMLHNEELTGYKRKGEWGAEGTPVQVAVLGSCLESPKEASCGPNASATVRVPWLLSSPRPWPLCRLVVWLPIPWPSGTCRTAGSLKLQGRVCPPSGGAEEETWDPKTLGEWAGGVGLSGVTLWPQSEEIIFIFKIFKLKSVNFSSWKKFQVLEM